jgi:branched-chain amino acid transport system permease protein
MVYGILKLINFAHGEVFMIGAMFSVLARRMKLHGPFALLRILVIARSTLRRCSVLRSSASLPPLRNQPRITSLITAIGVSLLIAVGGQKSLRATDRVFPQVWPALSRTLRRAACHQLRRQSS